MDEGNNIGGTTSDSGSFEDSESGMSDVSLGRESDHRATSVAGTDETELSSIVERMPDL